MGHGTYIHTHEITWVLWEEGCTSYMWIIRIIQHAAQATIIMKWAGEAGAHGLLPLPRVDQTINVARSGQSFRMYRLEKLEGGLAFVHSYAYQA